MKRSFRLSSDFDVAEGSYGSSQMWYPDQRHIKTGCAPAALANLYAWHSGLSLKKEEMLCLMEEVLTDLRGPVIHPLSFILGAKRFFFSRGEVLKASYILFLKFNKRKRRRSIELIAGSLADDCPPVLLMGPNRSGKEVYRKDFHNHWVLITGLDLIEDRVILTVSSWGQAFTLDLDQLVSSKRLISFLSLKPV